MTTKTGKILIALSLPVLVIAALQLNMIMSGLDRDLEPIALAMAGAGVLLFALGVGGASRRRSGMIAFVVGAGIIGMLFWRARSNGAHWHENQASDATMAAAVAGVCDGKVNIAAELPGAVRPIMRAGQISGESTWSSHPWDGLPAPASPAELQLVACVVLEQSTVATCDYKGKNGESYTISKYRVIHSLTVRDARTGKQVGSKTFEGPKPSDQCGESVKVSNRDGTTHEVTGGSPNESDEIAFLKTFVNPAGK